MIGDIFITYGPEWYRFRNEVLISKPIDGVTINKP